MKFEDKYLLDTVAISKLNRLELESSFLRDDCKIPEEVLYECRDFKHVKLLNSLVIPVTIELISTAQTVILGLDDDDKIIDLYNNEGNGDIILLATALHEMSKNGIQLFKTNWVIVTDDRLLTERAREFSIDSISSKEFRDIVKQ